jgi:hypothetical protein
LTSQSFCGARRMRAAGATALSVPRTPTCAPRPSRPVGDGESSMRGSCPEGRVLRSDQLGVTVGRPTTAVPRTEPSTRMGPVAVRQLEPRPGEGVRELIRFS